MRDFARGTYGHSSAFNHRTKKNGSGRRVFALLALAGLAIAAVGGLLWFIIWSRSFLVSEISVIGATAATEKRLRSLIDETLAEKSLGFIPRTNVPLFDVAGLEAAIRRSFFLESLTVTARLPHVLVVEVKEKPVRAVLTSDSRFLGLDAAGFVVRDLTDKEVRDLADLPGDMAGIVSPSLGAEQVDVSKKADARAARSNRNPLPLCVDATRHDGARSGEPVPGKQAFSPSIMELILAAYARLPDIAGPVRWFTVDETGESVQATMADGWDAYFTSALPFDKQGDNLGLVLKDKIKDRRPDLLYVDLRYNERIFIKYKEAPPTVGDTPAAGKK